MRLIPGVGGLSPEELTGGVVDNGDVARTVGAAMPFAGSTVAGSLYDARETVDDATSEPDSGLDTGGMSGGGYGDTLTEGSSGQAFDYAEDHPAESGTSDSPFIPDDASDNADTTTPNTREDLATRDLNRTVTLDLPTSGSSTSSMGLLLGLVALAVSLVVGLRGGGE